MLTVVTGPMYSGKSSTLIAMAKSHVIAGNKIAIFKPSIDSRYDPDNVVSHNGEKIPAIVLDIKDFRHTIFKQDVEVYFIEEAQFFDKSELWATVEQLIYMEDKTVVVAGLCQDFKGRPFGAMPQLLSIADNIICLKAVCSKCKRLASATRTFKKSNVDNKEVEVGGTELYESRCFRCWIKED